MFEGLEIYIREKSERMCEKQDQMCVRDLRECEK